LRQGGAGWGLLGAIAPGQPSGWLANLNAVRLAEGPLESCAEMRADERAVLFDSSPEIEYTRILRRQIYQRKKI